MKRSSTLVVIQIVLNEGRTVEQKRAFVEVVAPTVIASATRAGEPVAVVDSLPAATAKVTPAAMALRTALSVRAQRVSGLSRRLRDA